MTKPTIVFVHGAWHRPAHFEPLSQVLHSHGYPTRAVALPSVVEEGETPPEDPRTDITAIGKVIDEVLKGGSNVLVVPHSYGGIPTVSAVKGLDARTRLAAGYATHVIGIAAISAFLGKKGESLPTSIGLPTIEPGVYPNLYSNKGPVCWLDETSHDKMYNNMTLEESAPWRKLLGYQGLEAMYCLESEYSAHKDFPIHFLFCSNDHAMSPERQRLIIKSIQDDGGNLRLEESDSDHSPYLSNIHLASDFIRRSAGEDIPI